MQKYILLVGNDYIMKGTYDEVEQAIEDYIEEHDEADDIYILKPSEYLREIERMKALGMR